MSFSIRPSGHFSLRNFVSVSTTYLCEFGGLHKPFERKINGQNIESYKQYKRTNGMDYRPPPIPANRESETITRKISGFFAKKQMIRTLENPDIPEYKKIELLREFEMQPSSANIFAGGLMRDFEFEF
jgi:hypothetical protein